MQEKRTRKRLYFLFLARFLQSCFFRFSICLQCEPECHTVVVILAAALLEENRNALARRSDACRAEIEAILAKFRNEEMSVDALAAEVRRATTLIAFCRKRLLKAESDVKKITGE